MGNVESIEEANQRQNIPTEHVDDTDPALSCNLDVTGVGQRKITVFIVGAGMRGQIYASYAKDFPNRMKVVGVAEPITFRREMMKSLYKIDENYVFNDWKDVSIDKDLAAT